MFEGIVNPPMLTLSAVTKRFAASPGGVFDLSLSLESGETLALLGPSGSGKTTLLRLIAGLEVPDSGTIRINGRDMAGVEPHLRGIAYLAQKPALYPHLTVRELIDPADPNLIARLRLEPLLNRRPHELSGGEKQRVALARMAVRRAKLWLLDEPFAPLDPPFRAEFRHDLHLLAKDSAATIVMVTHDPIDAMAVGRRVGVLGDGRFQQLGSAEELARRPSSRFVAFCLGRMSFIPGQRESELRFRSTDGLLMLTAPGEMPETVEWGLRPDLFRPGIGAETAPGLLLRDWFVVDDRPDGPGRLITLTRGSCRVDVATDGRHRGDWWYPADRVTWFDAADGRRITGD